VGTQDDRLVFPQLFQALPNFHKFFYNLIEILRTCFLFLFAHTIITSPAHARSVFLSSYRNTIFNQSAHVFSLGYFQIFNVKYM